MDKVLIFNGSGYEVWSGEMKTLFRACLVWDLVKEGYKEKGRTKKGLEIDTRVDNTVLLVIKQKVTGPAANCIASAEKSKEAWDILKRKYKGIALQLYLIYFNTLFESPKRNCYYIFGSLSVLQDEQDISNLF